MKKKIWTVLVGAVVLLLMAAGAQLVVSAIEAEQDLSLIHISEPTRPY